MRNAVKRLGVLDHGGEGKLKHIIIIYHASLLAAALFNTSQRYIACAASTR